MPGVVDQRRRVAPGRGRKGIGALRHSVAAASTALRLRPYGLAFLILFRCSNGRFRCGVLGIAFSTFWQDVRLRMKTLRRQLIAKKHHGHHTSSPNLKLPESKRVLWGCAALVLFFAVAYYFLMPVADVITVRRGTAISAVYGTVRIEPAFVVRIRAQNDCFIQLAGSFSGGRCAIGKNVE